MPPRPLTNLIEAVPPETALEDVNSLNYFEDSLYAIFADTQNQHGDPGEMVVYRCEEYFGKDIKLGLPNPKKEDNKLFAHFLWNAGVQAAEMIASREYVVKGESVLELGAGAGLPGIVSALSGAKKVVLSDYPAPEILSNIEANIKRNLTPDVIESSNVSVFGHCWGELNTAKGDLFSASKHEPKSFTRIVVADCMWMDWQHVNLCSSIVHFLEPEKGEVLAIAGFHTGRPKVANFFKECENAGLVPVGKGIIERDVDGNEREWVGDRGREDVIERKKWLTICRLKLGKVANAVKRTQETSI
ncbi:hypothetical protein BDZ91DRAFT_793931 [Kalaharituber pfeilii]|nr:hypothetical protein BDZ91DRAFT_793931 [Kalaharituber pfeilii]